MTLRPTARLVALALAALAFGCADSGEGGDGGDEKWPAPAFEYPDLDGNTVSLADLRGKTVVIDFWATWCAPCVFQPAELNQVWAAHRDSGKLVVLGIEVGEASAEEVRQWGVENEAVAEYPILLGADEDLARRYGAMGFPAMVVIDPEGRIDSLTLGLKSAEEVEASITHLMGS